MIFAKVTSYIKKRYIEYCKFVSFTMQYYKTHEKKIRCKLFHLFIILLCKVTNYCKLHITSRITFIKSVISSFFLFSYFFLLFSFLCFLNKLDVRWTTSISIFEFCLHKHRSSVEDDEDVG